MSDENNISCKVCKESMRGVKTYAYREAHNCCGGSTTFDSKRVREKLKETA